MGSILGWNILGLANQPTLTLCQVDVSEAASFNVTVTTLDRKNNQNLFELRLIVVDKQKQLHNGLFSAD